MSRWYIFCFSVLIGFSGINICGVLQAQQPSIAAQVSHKSFEVGSSARIIISVFGGKPQFDMPSRIEAEGLSIHYVDESHVEPERFYYYRVSSNTPGEYVIPPIEAIVQGQTVRSLPINILVKPRAEVLAKASPRFALLKIPKSRLYVNQLFSLEAELYVKRQNAFVGDGITSVKLDHEKFVINHFGQLDIGREEIEGTFYSTGSMPTTAFCIQPGKHKLGPVLFEARIYIDSNRLIGRSPSSVSVRSDVVDVTINPLPVDAPTSFTGGVGEFELKSRTDSTEVLVGDPISIEFLVSGVGNLETMSAPVAVNVDKALWKLYTPRKIIEASSDGILPGKVRFSQVLVPLKVSSQLPSFELAYFSPISETYITRTIPARKLIVRKDNSSPSEPDLAIAVSDVREAAMPRDVVYFSHSDLSFRPASEQRVIPQWCLVLLNIAFGCLFMFGLIIGIRRSQSGFSRGKSAKPLTFKDASRLVKPGLSKNEFYHRALAAFNIWESEHEDAPEEARDIVIELRRKCENALYSKTGDHSDKIIATTEANEFIKVLRSIPAR